jgi:hypothetical protein
MKGKSFAEMTTSEKAQTRPWSNRRSHLEKVMNPIGIAMYNMDRSCCRKGNQEAAGDR